MTEVTCMRSIRSLRISLAARPSGVGLKPSMISGKSECYCKLQGWDQGAGTAHMCVAYQIRKAQLEHSPERHRSGCMHTVSISRWCVCIHCWEWCVEKAACISHFDCLCRLGPRASAYLSADSLRTALAGVVSTMMGGNW